MTRHLLAAALAAVMFASPALALAQSAPAAGSTSTYSDTAPKKAKSTTHKTASKSTKSKKAKAAAQ